MPPVCFCLLRRRAEAVGGGQVRAAARCGRLESGAPAGEVGEQGRARSQLSRVADSDCQLTSLSSSRSISFITDMLYDKCADTKDGTVWRAADFLASVLSKPIKCIKQTTDYMYKQKSKGSPLAASRCLLLLPLGFDKACSQLLKGAFRCPAPSKGGQTIQITL